MGDRGTVSDLDGAPLPMDLDTFTRACLKPRAKKPLPHGYEPATARRKAGFTRQTNGNPKKYNLCKVNRFDRLAT